MPRSPFQRPRPILIPALLAAALLTAAALPSSCPASDFVFGRGVFGPVTVEGNTSTRTDLILHELSFAPGDSFDIDVIDAAWEHLEDLGWFAFVDISWDDAGQVVPVTIVVEEERTTRGYPLIDYDRRHDVRLGAKVYDTNLRGRGERLQFEATWYRPHSYRLDWSHPWLLGVRGLELNALAGWEKSDYVYRDWDYEQWEAGLGLRWDFLPPLFVSCAAVFGSFEQEGYFDTAPGRPDFEAATRRRWTFSAAIGLDSRDSSSYPTSGGYHRVTGQRIESDDFDSYSMLTADLRQFIGTPWDHVLALRAWGRLTDGFVPPEDLLYWGGPDNLRGYRYASVEGEEGYLLSCEYRLPLFLMTISGDGRVIGLGLHAFADLGDNWYNGEPEGEGYFSWGGGAHINISSQQFRFELARTEDGVNVFQFQDHFNF